jgi:hypothetical protein
LPEQTLRAISIYSPELTAAARAFNQKYWNGALRNDKVYVAKGNIPGDVGAEGGRRPLGMFYRDSGNIYIAHSTGVYSKAQILLHELVHKAVGESTIGNTQHDGKFVAEANRVEQLSGFKIYFPHRHEQCPGGRCLRH